MNATIDPAVLGEDIELNIEEEFKLEDKAVLINVSFSMFHNERKLADELYETQADKSRTGAHKRLVDSQILKNLNSLCGETCRWLSSICLRSPYKKGIYLLPLPLLLKVQAKMKLFQAKWLKLVAEFVEVWPLLVEAAAKPKEQGGLGPAFDLRQYPSLEDLPGLFSMRWRYGQFITPGSIQAISPEVYEEAMTEARRDTQALVAEIREELRAGMVKLVRGLAVSLNGGQKDGKKKVLKDATIDNVKEFLELFDSRNIIEDKDLARLAEEARRLMSGADGEGLRSDPMGRKQLATEMDKVVAQLDSLAVDAPTRMIDFD